MYCYRSGEVFIGINPPNGTVVLASGEEGALIRASQDLGKVWIDSLGGISILVPGLGEAPSENDAIRIVTEFRAKVVEHMQNNPELSTRALYYSTWTQESIEALR